MLEIHFAIPLTKGLQDFYRCTTTPHPLFKQVKIAQAVNFFRVSLSTIWPPSSDFWHHSYTFLHLWKCTSTVILLKRGLKISYSWIINGRSWAHQIFNRISGKLTFHNFFVIKQHLWCRIVTWFHSCILLKRPFPPLENAENCIKIGQQTAKI